MKTLKAWLNELEKKEGIKIPLHIKLSQIVDNPTIFPKSANVDFYNNSRYLIISIQKPISKILNIQIKKEKE